jgi:uncharacterized protein (DUF4415 family)
MQKPPNRFRSNDPRTAAEAAFKQATTKATERIPAPKKLSLPRSRETVSLRIDRDVLEHFQKDGPGWQDGINQALRQTAGLHQKDRVMRASGLINSRARTILDAARP